MLKNVENEMQQLPTFETDEQLARWVESHDTTDLLDRLEDADEEFEVMRTPLSTRIVDLRLRADYLQAIEDVAARRGIPHQLLIRDWLLERLYKEAPELLPQAS